MWILSCEDDSLLQGKRLWLRPGTEFLIGRTKPSLEGDQRFGKVDLKSISRHHLTINVKSIEPGSSAELHSRPTVEIVDHSKIGTSIDGSPKFAKDTRNLSTARHELILGNWDKKIVLEWQPVVFTATSLGKKSKDPVSEIRDKVERFGFKVVAEYQSGKTTHVVASKRNIPQVLNALVDGKHVVTSDFIDEIVREAQPNGVLEDDVSGWPKESNFLPPSGKEPVLRPSELLLPNAARQDVFAGYTFVFCDSKQHESLIGPITCGSGKAQLYTAFAWGQTSPQQFAAYVKNVAGEKDAEELDQGAESKGVVVVRVGDSKDPKDEVWRESFIKQSDLLLGQRSILQNEFLDAIIMCNARDLKKPLEDEIDISSTAPAPSKPSTVQERRSQDHAADNSEIKSLGSTHRAAEQQAVPNSVRRPRRPVVKSRTNAFDDFDPSQISKPVNDDGDDFRGETSQRPKGTRTIPADSQSISDLRRKDPPMDDVEEEEEDGFDNLLPAAAALKRRREEMGAEEGAAAGNSAVITKPSKKRQRKESPEMDVRGAARKRKEEADAATHEDEETMKEMMKGLDIEAIRGLITIEDMELPDREPTRRNRQTDDNETNERWKPEWNGRKNFKKFRRKGEATGDAPLRGHKVIIPLEEVSRRKFGIGEDYWLESNTSRKSKSQSQRRDIATSRMPSAEHVSDGEDDSDDDVVRFRTRRSTQNVSATQADTHEDVELEREDTEQNTATDRTNGKSQRGVTSQSRKSQGTTKKAGKRPATDEGRAASKRTRTTKTAAPVITVSDSDDDDDGLRFKFKSKR